MILGHPGEGKKDFAELLDFVREARFERLGAFMYSEEEGTYGAANYKDRISRKEKSERLAELMKVQSEISLAFNQSRVSTCERVLVDDFVDGVLVCRSRLESPEVDGEILVTFKPEIFGVSDGSELCGKFLDVRITGADEYDLIAEPVK